MNRPRYQDLMEQQWADGKFACVGLDSELGKIPNFCNFDDLCSKIFAFNAKIIDATRDLTGFYKPNIAFYEEHGEKGAEALKDTISYIHDTAPEVPVILDYKRADIGNTNNGYVKSAFDYFNADAVTVNPYFGEEAMKPFLDVKDKGIIVLARTSNKGAGEFQDLLVDVEGEKIPLYLKVARNVARKWNVNGNCGLVVGATAPVELKKVRDDLGDIPLLLPGVGKQGADVAAAVQAGLNKRKSGIIVNSSSGIIFASKEQDFAEAARHETEKLSTAIRQQIEVIARGQ